MAYRERIWGTRSGHTAEIAESVVRYLKEHPANYQGQVDTLLELIYQTFTEYNSAETPEFRKQVDPLDETLRSLVGYSCAGVPLFRRNGYRQSSGRKPLFRNRDTALN